MPHRNVRGPDIVGYSPEQLAESASEEMKSVLERVRTVAPTRATVLLTGETGVGKGVIAKLIHRWSSRREMPFIAVHCGAIPDTLLESELFGHEKGSFTDAHRRRQGKFEMANGGTLFLDEVGTITHSAQVKLLDVLQERRFHRVGGDEDVEVDIRIVAASNNDLDRMQKDGLFRADLFHRLNVFPIRIPPLRERKDDLPGLVAQMLERLNGLYSKNIEGLDSIVEQAFQSYAWPGNVRELENVVERAHIIEATTRISARSIPFEILGMVEAHVLVPTGASKTLAEIRNEAVTIAERCYLIELLRTQQGRIDASARAAGITTRQLRNLLTKYGIRKTDFKPTRPSRNSSPGATTSGHEVAR